MRAVITGAGGFVGRHLKSHLEEAGDEVIGLDSSAGPDVRDRLAWKQTVQDHAPEVVYHLAGWSDVGASWNNPTETFEVNAMGTVSVLDASRQGGVGRVVVISSADVYGAVSPGQLPITEEQSIQPRSPYGLSKQAAEAVAMQYWHGHGLETVVARPFNHLGAGQSSRFVASSFASQIASAEVGDSIRLCHGDLNPRRDITDVRDVVRSYRLLATAGQPGQIYNVCSGSDISIYDLLEGLLSLSEVDVERHLDPALIRPVEVPVLRGSFEKIELATGWSPQIPLEETLASLLQDARTKVSRQG